LADSPYILISLAAFFAFVVKALTGFGTAIVFVAFGSLLIGTRQAVILCALIDAIGGGVLYRRDPVHEHRAFWIPLAAAIAAGSVAGAFLLLVFPADRLEILVAAVVFVLGVWFLAGRGENGGCALSESLLDRVAVGDIAVLAFGGICGGLFAVSGPPIVYWLGRKYAKHAFRRTLIVIFFFSNIARLLTYGATGMLTSRIALLALAAVPGVLMGIILGNRIFFAVSERRFSRIIGVMLVIIALRMIIL